MIRPCVFGDFFLSIFGVASHQTVAASYPRRTYGGGGGRKRLPKFKFKFSAKFPIGLHVILQIQIKKNSKMTAILCEKLF